MLSKDSSSRQTDHSGGINRISSNTIENETRISSIIFEAFVEAIYHPAESRCEICTRLMYEVSIRHVIFTDVQQKLLNDIGFHFDITKRHYACHKCLTPLNKRNSKIPAQALYNNLICTKVPDEISTLTKVEVDLIRRINPFMKI